MYLLRDHDGVVAADLLRAELPVVERALVLVRVPVHRAEQPAAAALEPYHTQNDHFKFIQFSLGKYLLHLEKKPQCEQKNMVRRPARIRVINV